MVGPPQDDAAERLVRASRRDRLGDAADDLVSDDAEAHDDAVGDALRVEAPGGDAVLHRAPDAVAADVDVVGRLAAADMDGAAPGLEIGRASCRERVCQDVSLRVDAVSFKKQHRYTSRSSTQSKS